MAGDTDGLDRATQRPMAAARRDLVTGGVTVAAIVLLVGTGSPVLSAALRSLAGLGSGEQLLSTALILNVALVLFGWRRYADLRREAASRSEAETRAAALASHDALTGMLNRRAAAGAIATLLDRAGARGKSLALLMLDLDQFKTVNDINGHMMGDAVLKSVAERIAANLPSDAITARFGGDEFACAFTFDPAAPDTVDAIVERLASQLAVPIEADGVTAHVTASLGVAATDSDCATVDALMRRADIAMHVSKNAGRNRYCWFDASMERELHLRNAIETGMRVGIPLGQFVPYYEQQIDLTTGRLHGFEMLARWNHPTRGLVAPDIFIPIAEETGIIADLSMSVMRQAFEEAKNWDSSLTLSVNISPTQLKDPWLAQKIVKLLVETGFPANRLEVEITESSLFENLGLAQSIIGSLKNQGVRIALDDFGTGYSSLAHLRALPFDRIKIDRSFVSSITTNTESAAIVHAITRLGDSLGLPITAEGIEDAVIEERLRELGCNKGQGWHFGKPIPVEQVRSMLAEQNLLPAARLAAAPPADDVKTLRRAG